MAQLYLACLIAYLLAVCLPQENAAQTVAVTVATAVHTAFVIAVWKKTATAAPKTIEGVIIFFGIEILALTGWLGIGVFRDTPAFLFPLMLVLMSQIYTLRPRVIIPLIDISAAVLILASALTKQPDIFVWDAVSCVIAAAISAVSYFTSLRYKTDMFDLEQDLRHMCSVDGMTGVLNKTTFEYYAGDFLRKRKGGGLFALAVIDLDRFKTINDSFGHKAGDDSLLAFSSMLKSAFSDPDSYCVGRFGGDEFVVLLRNAVSADETKRLFLELADSIRASVGFPVPLTCSIGVAVSDRSDITFLQLFLAADRALYTAKNSGGDGLRVTEIDGDVEAAPLMLVSDGNEADREALQAIFSGRFRLIETAGPKETLDMVQRYRDALAVIITDMTARESDGREAIRRIRKLPEMRGVPIIAITDGKEAVEPGVQGELKKPFDAASAAECAARAAGQMK